MRSELGSVVIAGLAAVLVAVLVLGAGCADFQRGAYWDEAEDGAEGASETAAAGAYGYAADVHPLMDTGCERCHAPGNSAGSTDFLIIRDDIEASYASTLEFVDLDEPAASPLLSKMAGLGHGGGAVFDDRSPEYALVLAWIEQGAPP